MRRVNSLSGLAILEHLQRGQERLRASKSLRSRRGQTRRQGAWQPPARDEARQLFAQNFCISTVKNTTLYIPTRNLKSTSGGVYPQILLKDADSASLCCHLRKPAPPTGDAEMHSRTLREDVIDFLDLRRESRQKGKSPCYKKGLNISSQIRPN